MDILWNGYCYGTSGYANAGRGLLSALTKLGNHIHLLPVDRRKKKKYPHIKKLELYRGKKPKVAVFHRMPNGFSKMANWNVGVTYWETTRLPHEWVEHCNRMDQLILFSEQNHKAFRESGVRVPIDVIPSGVSLRMKPLSDPSSTLFEKISKEKLSLLRNQTKPFTFLSVSQWIPRKGFEILIKAYFAEFSMIDDVCLIIKTNRTRDKSQTQVYQELKEIKNRTSKSESPQLVFYSGTLPETQMNALYQLSDAYVLPSRGEGVGLPYLEAGKHGLPVIATGWGGQTDFLNEQNSYVLDYALVPAQQSVCSPYFWNDQMWAEPSVDHLRQLMRKVYESQEVAKLKGEVLKRQIEIRHNWQTIAKEFKQKIKLAANNKP